MRTAKADITIRALAREDLDAVVAIDAGFVGRSRRAYFERRRAVALKQPELYVQLAAVDAQGLAGCILARHELGEFGRARPGLQIEVVAVRAEWQRRGVGRRLLDAVMGYAARRGIAELRTISAWNDHGMRRWLHASRFGLASDLLVECGLGAGGPAELAAVRDPADGLHEAHDGARRTRCDVRPMRREDLPQIVRIDRHLTGRDRAAYIGAKLGEAMDDSAIRVSLTARLDDAVVGFVMARADLGDFGRLEPVAVLDTIAVDPAYARRGVGRALMSQLVANFAALRIDRVQTAVRLSELPLIGWLLGLGFVLSPRLAFVRPVPVRPA
ncbi:MAG TPA: GNAT family N-acetyltransferase [Albitalea sp.]